jgi:uncharacterized protein DUF6617
MEVKILDSILHGALKPWKLDVSNTRHFTELVKTAKAVSPNTNAGLLKQLIALLADYPDLQKVLTDETPNDNTPLQQLLFTTSLPKYIDPVTQFYYTLITAETLRFNNAFLQQAANWTELVDIRYQVVKTLTNIRVLAKQTVTELNEQGFASVPDEQSSFVHFALYYLKHSLIQLYFSAQESFKDSLPQVTTLEDFYTSDLEELPSNLLPLHYATPELKGTAKKSLKPQKLSFQFKGDAAKLKTVVTQLCLHCNLINDTTNKEEEVLKVFNSKDLKQDAVKINIGCETAQFRHILDKLKPWFDNLSFAIIEKAGIFHSKNGTLLTAQNLYSSKIDHPKTKEEIDKIINHLQ